MAVKSRDGAQVGRILDVTEEGLLVEKGVFLVRDYLIPFREVYAVSGEDVLLDQTREHLERAHRAAGTLAAVETGRLGQSPSDFTEARMDSAKFQDHGGYTPTAGGWGHQPGAAMHAAGLSGNLGLGPTDLTEARMDSAKFQDHDAYDVRPTGAPPHEPDVAGPERVASGPGWDALSEDEKREAPRMTGPEDLDPKTRY
jgi:hypothetical protein